MLRSVARYTAHSLLCGLNSAWLALCVRPALCVWLALCAWLVLCACGEPETKRVQPAPKPVSAAELKPVPAAVEKAPSASSLGDVPPSSLAEAKPMAGARSCAVRTQHALAKDVELASVVGHGQGASLLWQRREAERSLLELARSDAGQVTTQLSVPLPTALLMAPVPERHPDGSLDVALVDVQHTLSIVRIVNSKASAPRLIAKGIDARFAPALARFSGGLLVAYTQTVDQAMHTFVARVTDKKLDVRDVTPLSHGASTPRFVLGAKLPTLVMLDARAGVSPLLEVLFDANGLAKPAIVRTPVSQPYTPPLLFAVQLPHADTQVAYTAIGRAAATAVGIVALRRAEAPRALLPSLGYGPLSFAAAVGERAAVFALESPVSAAASAPRALVVKVVDEMGEGPELRLEATDGSLSKPALASGTKRQFFLLYRDGLRSNLTILDCDA